MLMVPDKQTDKFNLQVLLLACLHAQKRSGIFLEGRFFSQSDILKHFK